MGIAWHLKIKFRAFFTDLFKFEKNGTIWILPTVPPAVETLIPFDQLQTHINERGVFLETALVKR